LSNEEDEYLRALRERRRKSFSGDIFERMDYRPPPQHAEIEESIKGEDGEEIYSAKRHVTVDPYTLEQKQKITYTTKKCSCGEPITGQMLATELIQKCTVCGQATCPSCRANTEIEYLKPEVRGQTVCKNCFNQLASQLLLTCPTCSQPIKENKDVKVCAYCPRKICESCGIRLPIGAYVCSSCFGKHFHKSEADRLSDELFRECLEKL